MKILMVTGTYSLDGSRPWLLDDLCRVLAERGHSVDVIVHDAKNGHPRGEVPDQAQGVTAWSVGSTKTRRGALQKLLGYLQAGIGLHTLGYKIAKTSTYDLCVFTSIACFSWGFPGRVRKSGVAKRLALILWDFFPIHQLEIGRIRPRALGPVLKAIERMAISPADHVALMTSANEAFFRSYHPRIRARTLIIPPWSSSGELPSAGFSKLERFTVIFGGQLARGRGVETLLDAALLLQNAHAPVDIVIAGDGAERNRLEEHAQNNGISNVTFAGHLERDAYRALLKTVHVGVAITVPGVSPPTFPSKIVEYCGVALPVIVCVEPSSDAGLIVETAGAGVSTPAGDPEALADAIRVLLGVHSEGALDGWSSAAQRLYEEQFSTVSAARSLEDLVHEATPISAPKSQ